jgi:hypothetical protein
MRGNEEDESGNKKGSRMGEGVEGREQKVMRVRRKVGLMLSLSSEIRKTNRSYIVAREQRVKGRKHRKSKEQRDPTSSVRPKEETVVPCFLEKAK